MTDRKRTIGAVAALAALALALSACTAITPDEPVATVTPRTLAGSIVPLATGVDLAGWTVTAWNTSRDGARDLGRATSDERGAFTLSIDETDVEGVVWIDARPAEGDRALLGAIATPAATQVTLNERTTVAAGYGLAQFFGEAVPTGQREWVDNAATMAANLADPTTGAVGATLTAAPHNSASGALGTFTSLTAMLSGCLQRATVCNALFGAAGKDRDRLVSAGAAFAGIARDPAGAPAKLFRLARGVDGGLAAAPAAWTIALRFSGSAAGLSAPGSIAVDPNGHVWVGAGYRTDPTVSACGVDRAYEFSPAGTLLTTVTGDGHSGFGLDFDRTGQLWMSTVGSDAAAPCADTGAPARDGLAVFDGQRAIAPLGGYTQGELRRPQGVETDNDANVWIASCGNDTVARYPKGAAKNAENIGSLSLAAPFDIVDNGRHIFVTGNGNSSVAVLGRDGTPIEGGPLQKGFDRPTGIAADGEGNVWVANSADSASPCGDRVGASTGTPSVTMIAPDAETVSAPFTGGGLTVPWGIATDGDGNVWVANLTGGRVSEFCGAKATTCPRGKETGASISPNGTGYPIEGLTGSAGIAIDVSGNVWLTAAAGGGQPAGIVALVGAAAPVYIAPFD